MNNFLKVALVAGSIAVLGAPGRAQEVLADTSRHITVIGNGAVTTTSDILRITLAVQAEAIEASDAIRDMSAQLEDVLTTSTGAGLALRDIQTAGLRLFPRRTDNRDGSLPLEQAGFIAASDITLIVRDLTQSGSIIDAVVAAGTTQINGLQFDVAAREPLLARARQAAIADAIAKTSLYAEAAALEVLDILTIEEFTDGGGFPRAFSGAAARDVPIVAGAFEITAQVTVVTAVQ
jgi:uncharacterized protein YggE